MYLILYKINNYWYSLFDITSSLVYENNVDSLIGGHIRRIYNNSSEDASQSPVFRFTERSPWRPAVDSRVCQIIDYHRQLANIPAKWAVNFRTPP